MNTNNELPKSIKLNEHGTGLRVALHLQFHRKAYELISAVDKKKLHLTNDLLNDWKLWIDIEVDLSLEAKTSVLTAKLRDLDKQRRRTHTLPLQNHPHANQIAHHSHSRSRSTPAHRNRHL